jgi:hypothetical protein
MNPKAETFDIRLHFSLMDPLALICAEQVGLLIGAIGEDSVHYKAKMGTIPAPRGREEKWVRWQVRDIRNWLEAMPPAPLPRPRNYSEGKRAGRPRNALRTKTTSNQSNDIGLPAPQKNS